MGLPDQRPAATGQAVEQRDLPQRAAAVQPVRVEVGAPVQQLALVPRVRQRRMADVRVELEARITLPRRPGEPAGARPRQLLPIAGQLIQARADVLANLMNRRRPPTGKRIEHQRATDVHQRALVVLLELQERGIERCQLVCGHVNSSASRRSLAYARPGGSTRGTVAPSSVGTTDARRTPRRAREGSAGRRRPAASRAPGVRECSPSALASASPPASRPARRGPGSDPA